MRYKKYKINFNDVDGVGGRLSKSFGMYDIATAVTISGEPVENNEEQDIKPKVYCTSRNKWLVIAAGCDINVFYLAVGIEHKWSISFEETDKVICVKFLPDDEVFIAVLSSGIISLIMPFNLLMKSEKILPPLSNCSIAIVNEPVKYSFCILEDKGSAYFLEINKLGALAKKEIDMMDLKLLFSSEKFNCQFVVWALHCFAYFPKSKGDRVKVSPIHCFGNNRFSDWFILKENLRVIQNVGRFIVALTIQNQLIFYDLNLKKLHSLNINFLNSANARPGFSESKHQVLDFEFLDIAEFTEFNSDVRVLFKVKMDSECEFILRSLGNSSTLFNTVCSDEMILIPHATPGDDSNIIFVEVFPTAAPNNITVRFISEAQPSLRLKRLLDFGRFNDALQFAKQHELSLDTVYTAFIRNCQDQILNENNYDESVFEELMKYLALLSNHDEACDFCVAALMIVNKYEHIVKILEFTQQKKISDEGTVSEIANFRYELASYRMFFGSNHASYDKESPWFEFLSADNHVLLFDKFCQEGSIAEARILFSRYPIDIQNHFASFAYTDRLLDLLSTSITENPAIHLEISEFIASDLLKYFLFYQNMSDIVSKCELLFNFLIDTSKGLERIQPKFFPENSLNFALSFQRGLTSLKKNCLTSDQQVEPILVLDMLNIDSSDENLAIGRLNILIKNLKRLVRIHRIYQCPMSYSEFLNRDVQTICYGILDRVRTAQSVRDHIDRFVFPYMLEHQLDKNEMLHKYIKQLASNLYRGSSQYSNSWDQLCLQIAESIVDLDLRCKAVIEIAAASIPPWSEQLMTVVKNTLINTENVDPSLIEQLRIECKRAELGQIFVVYHIPLNFRSFSIDVVSLKALLQFIFKNSDKDPSVKLNDTFKILTIYESLMGYQMVNRVECFRLYAISIIMQMTNEYELNKLINFFQLIKSTEERGEVAWKLVEHLKGLLVESRLKKIKEQRLIWIASLLCVLERFVTNNIESARVSQQTRNLRCLQVQHNLIIGFSTLEDSKKCSKHLTDFIHESSTKKSLFEVVTFGELFSMSLRNIFYTIVDIYLDKVLPEASMSTLEFFVEREIYPNISDLDICHRVYTSTLWNITNAAVDTGTEFEPLVRIVKLFKSTLPLLLDWSTKLQSLTHIYAFCQINGYITLLNHILESCPVDKGEANEHEEIKYDELELSKNLMYSNRKRVGSFLPFNEGSFFDHSNIIRNAAIVASSVSDSPIDGEENIIKFNYEMREYWQRLYVSLSTHNLLEIFARHFSYSLPCFNTVSDNSPLIGLPQCILELCQKILNISTADLLLSAHLLLSLLLPNLKQSLQDLRRWVINNRKSVRIALNVIRLSLFVLIESKDYSLKQQIASMFETTLWQKRFTKLGVLTINPQQLRKESALDLVSDFVKVLVPPYVLKQFCQEMQVPSKILLNYAIELCKVSSNFIKERERFHRTIDTAKEVEADEESIQEIVSVIDQICPYNYEVLELLLKQLEEWNKIQQTDYTVWIKDRLLLLEFLKYVKREKSYTQEEMKWYRTRSSNKNLDASASIRSNSVDETSLMDEDNESAPNSVSALLGGLYHKQDVFEMKFPSVSVDRLPFHAFLVPVEQHPLLMLPIIHNEINIYNVSKWITVIIETEDILNCSKTLLIVTAIHHDVVNAIKYKRELLNYDLIQIRRLMNDSLRRVTVLKSLGHKFRKLPLCDVKISIFQVCYDVVSYCIENWIDSDEDKTDYITYRDALKRTLAQFTTDLLLSKNHLLDSNTSALSNDAVSLISYICSNCIDWNDDANIETHFRVVENIAKVNEVDLSAVYDELILSWLPGSEIIEVGNMALSDPDATIDFVGSDVGVAALSSSGSIDEETPLPVLYSDPSLSKIVFLLKKCDPQIKARMIYHKFEQESTFTPSGFMTKVRTACCLIRYLSNQQMQEILVMDKAMFCSRLIQLLNNRLLSVSRMGISINDYQNTDKVEFVRSILSPHSYRQTPEVSHLLTCVIVDNEIKDVSLIGKAAHRLFQLRMMKPLIVLLDYIRRLEDAKVIPNIAMFYARVFEWLFDKTDIDEEESSAKLFSMVFNLIGCPVEGSSNFLRAKTLLARFPCAAAIVSLAGSATEKVDMLNSRPVDSSSVSLDIKLNRVYI